MADYDASVRVDTKADNSDLQKLAKDFEKIEKTSDSIREKLKLQEGNWNSLSDVVEDYETRIKNLRNKGFGPGDKIFDELYIGWKNATNAEKEYLANLDKMTDKGMADEVARVAKEQAKQAEAQRKIEEAAERNLQKETARLEKEAQIEAKLQAKAAEQERLSRLKNNAAVSDEHMVELIQRQVDLKRYLNDLKKAGVTAGYEQYDTTAAELQQINSEIAAREKLSQSIRQQQDGFARVRVMAQRLFKSVQNGTKKSNGLLVTMGSRLKGIALSLLVFNWITKGFNAMVSAMKEGFKNIAQYSKDYNSAMSEMKSECAELKNNLAVAFEPVVTAVIPYITQLVSWLNTATESLGKLLAVMSGKSTYTRAKKQVIDYAKSLDTANNSAKGALASFDSINVLSDNQSAGGAVSGADAFETVTMTEEDYLILDRVKEKLSDILNILLPIGAAMAIFGIGGPLGTFVYVLIIVIGLLKTAYEYMDAWSNGISFDNLIGMTKGLLAVFLGIYMLFGKFAAGLALIVAGVALVVLAIKDMIDNGINAQNCITLLIGVVVALVGIFMTFGSTAALVVGAIVAVISIFAGLIAIAGNGEEAIATLKSMFKNFADFFKKIFAGDIEGAMESLKLAGKDFVNVIIIAFESLINCIIKGLNWLIEKINSISFDVPDWVPFIGGETLSPNIPAIKEVSLPRLATGAITNGPTRALIGEAGREAVLPLENNTGWMDSLADKLAERIPSGNSGPVYLQIDGKTFAKLELPHIKAEERRIGVSLKMT